MASLLFIVPLFGVIVPSLGQLLGNFNVGSLTNVYLENYSNGSQVLNDGKVQEPVNLIQKQGFPAETHTIQTEDGYILSVHRIPRGRKPVKPRGPVLLHHGFLASSDSWLLREANEDLAFILADAGYDVWLANTRGNSHSNRHISLTTRSSKYWNFGFHEVAVYDLPATIDYILKETNEKKLFFIGHSMGTMITYILCSVRPEYNQKFRLNVNMAPAVFLKARSFLEKQMVVYLDEFLKTVTDRRIFEIFPMSPTTARLAKLFCSDGHPLQDMCAVAFSLTLGMDFTRAKGYFIPKLFEHFPQGTSARTLDHFLQNIKTGDFRQYDYGLEENMKRYGEALPPRYDLSKVTAPTTLHYGLADILIKTPDVKKLAKRLPNVVGLYPVPDPTFNHNDFLWGFDTPTMVYAPILKIMEKF